MLGCGANTTLIFDAVTGFNAKAKPIMVGQLMERNLETVTHKQQVVDAMFSAFTLVITADNRHLTLD